MQQWWFDDGLRLISLFTMFFMIFPSFLRFSLIFMNIKKMICIFDHGMKVLQSLLPFIYLLEVYDLAMVTNALERKLKI